MCNKLPFLNNMFITPWEDCSHFKEKWLQDIQKYQGKFVAKMLLTKERGLVRIFIQYQKATRIYISLQILFSIPQ